MLTPRFEEIDIVVFAETSIKESVPKVNGEETL